MKGSTRRKCRTREHVIADLSVNFFERFALLRRHSIERKVHDYGIDVLLYTYDTEGEIENGEVVIQLKATDHVKRSADGTTIPWRVDIRDLNHWVYEIYPVILVVYDAAGEVAYWVHVQDYADKHRLDDGRGSTTTVRVPVANRINEDAIDQFQSLREQVVVQAQAKLARLD